MNNFFLDQDNYLNELSVSELSNSPGHSIDKKSQQLYQFDNIDQSEETLENLEDKDLYVYDKNQDKYIVAVKRRTGTKIESEQLFEENQQINYYDAVDMDNLDYYIFDDTQDNYKRAYPKLVKVKSKLKLFRGFTVKMMNKENESVSELNLNQEDQTSELEAKDRDLFVPDEPKNVSRKSTIEKHIKQVSSRFSNNQFEIENENAEENVFLSKTRNSKIHEIVEEPSKTFDRLEEARNLKDLLVNELDSSNESYLEEDLVIEDNFKELSIEETNENDVKMEKNVQVSDFLNQSGDEKLENKAIGESSCVVDETENVKLGKHEQKERKSSNFSDEFCNLELIKARKKEVEEVLEEMRENLEYAPRNKESQEQHLSGVEGSKKELIEDESSKNEEISKEDLIQESNFSEEKRNFIADKKKELERNTERTVLNEISNRNNSKILDIETSKMDSEEEFPEIRKIFSSRNKNSEIKSENSNISKGSNVRSSNKSSRNLKISKEIKIDDIFQTNKTDSLISAFNNNKVSKKKGFDLNDSQTGKSLSKEEDIDLLKMKKLSIKNFESQFESNMEIEVVDNEQISVETIEAKENQKKPVQKGEGEKSVNKKVDLETIKGEEILEDKPIKEGKSEKSEKEKEKVDLEKIKTKENLEYESVQKAESEKTLTEKVDLETVKGEENLEDKPKKEGESLKSKKENQSVEIKESSKDKIEKEKKEKELSKYHKEELIPEQKVIELDETEKEIIGSMATTKRSDKKISQKKVVIMDKNKEKAEETQRLSRDVRNVNLSENLASNDKHKVEIVISNEEPEKLIPEKKIFKNDNFKNDTSSQSKLTKNTLVKEEGNIHENKKRNIKLTEAKSKEILSPFESPKVKESINKQVISSLSFGNHTEEDDDKISFSKSHINISEEIKVTRTSIQPILSSNQAETIKEVKTKQPNQRKLNVKKIEVDGLNETVKSTKVRFFSTIENYENYEGQFTEKRQESIRENLKKLENRINLRKKLASSPLVSLGNSTVKGNKQKSIFKDYNQDSKQLKISFEQFNTARHNQSFLLNR